MKIHVHHTEHGGLPTLSVGQVHRLLDEAINLHGNRPAWTPQRYSALVHDCATVADVSRRVREALGVMQDTAPAPWIWAVIAASERYRRRVRLMPSAISLRGAL